MNQYMFFIILLILFGCGEPHHHTVMVNKTVKVFSKHYHEQAENYIFKWQPPIGPNNKKIIFDLKNDMLIFTPETVGIYEVNLSIEDISDDVVAKEIFYFNAILETLEVAIVEPAKALPSPSPPSITDKNPKKQHAKKSQTQPVKKKKPKKRSKKKKQSEKPKITPIEYAIQISAWPSLEEARKHQLELIDEGFDAYIQHFYSKNQDEVWYRVRVGNFSNRNNALIIKQQIESIIDITTWLDILSAK